MLSPTSSCAKRPEELLVLSRSSSLLPPGATVTASFGAPTCVMDNRHRFYPNFICFTLVVDQQPWTIEKGHRWEREFAGPRQPYLQACLCPFIKWWPVSLAGEPDRIVFTASVIVLSSGMAWGCLCFQNLKHEDNHRPGHTKRPHGKQRAEPLRRS